jgi:hypothetical protein
MVIFVATRAFYAFLQTFLGADKFARLPSLWLPAFAIACAITTHSYSHEPDTLRPLQRRLLNALLS